MVKQKLEIQLLIRSVETTGLLSDEQPKAASPSCTVVYGARITRNGEKNQKDMEEKGGNNT